MAKQKHWSMVNTYIWRDLVYLEEMRGEEDNNSGVEIVIQKREREWSWQTHSLMSSVYVAIRLRNGLAKSKTTKLYITKSFCHFQFFVLFFIFGGHTPNPIYIPTPLILFIKLYHHYLTLSLHVNFGLHFLRY
jgi:hypothetical protein